jgi:TPR repeat protein
MLRHGEGGPIDLVGAAKLYRQAADHNDLRSILLMGELSARGEGVTRSASDAAMWYRRAAALGNAEACYRLGVLLLDPDRGWTKGRSSHRPSRNSREALIWLQMAADQNYAPALYVLGMTAWGGIIQTLDNRKAFLLIGQAADQAYPPALRQLAAFYRAGEIVAKDSVRALMYSELADQIGEGWRDGPTACERRFAPHTERDDTIAPPQQLIAKKRAQEWLQLRGL